MPEFVWEILVGVVLVGLVAYIWLDHDKRDRERIKALWDQVGRDSRSGMRKDVHDVGNLRIRASELERRVARIERYLNGGLKEQDER